MRHATAEDPALTWGCTVESFLSVRRGPLFLLKRRNGRLAWVPADLRSIIGSAKNSVFLTHGFIH